ncbi:MAG: hypothetical protein CML26_01865 [Rhizobiales bacterium]|nr:hypothetical protein [Hyphomicrobiales bacterium]
MRDNMSYDYENIEQIKQLKYRYCRGIDSCNIEELGRVFTEDARINYQGGSYTFEAEGKENILTAMKFAFHDKLVSCHTVHMPVIEITGETTAKGQWRLLDYAMNLAEDNKVTVGGAEYVDDYVKNTDGVWQIKQSVYTRVYEQVFLQDNHNLTHYQLGGGLVKGEFSI